MVLTLLATDASVARAGDHYVIPLAKQNHWAWKPPVRPATPVVQTRAWLKNPIDAFILAKLEGVDLPPAAPATREHLIRRVTFNLIGLPPTPAEIDAFVNDSSPNAWERVIDRLLESPHYGQRWGRHWLDLVRFAESNGFEFDEPRPDAWRYRDYVVRSFSADKPYDRFLKEQIAGDELYPDDADALIATGFNLLGPDMTDSSDQAQRRQNTLNDMTDATGLAFLGLTVGCARCHDHKFEPIPQSDYYRLQAFFTPAEFRRDLPISTKDQRAAYDAAFREYRRLVQPIQDSLAQLEAPYRQKVYESKLARLSEEAQVAHKTSASQRTPAQKELAEKTNRLLGVLLPEVLKLMTDSNRLRHRELETELRKFDAQRPRPLPVALGLTDRPGSAPKTHLLERGELENAGAEVEPGYLRILLSDRSVKPAPVRQPRPATTGRRTALAHWIASRENPLTARVLVNRLWQHHFGRGIVPTASDFGTRGEPPTHPELLDWLATQFVRSGWRIKPMHKLMLTSATYQQSSLPTAAARDKDAHNRWFSHMNRQRLEGEIIRDSLLAVSGRLNLQLGGPSVFPPVPAEANRDPKEWPLSPNPRDHLRRSIYIFARRNLRFPFLEAFDLPDSNLSCPKRERSTTAPQALALLNASDVIQATKTLGARLEKEWDLMEDRITLAYRLVLGRRPSENEVRESLGFLHSSPLHELCRALFNMNEFVYLD